MWIIGAVFILVFLMLVCKKNISDEIKENLNEFKRGTIFGNTIKA